MLLSPSMRPWIALSVKLAVGIALALPLTGAANNWTVSLRGVGPIRLGMTLSAVRRALKDQAASLDGDAADVQECAYLESSAIPEYLGVMFVHGRVVRVDVSAAGIHTMSGAGVGDTEARIKLLYPGRVTVEAAFYDSEHGHFLNYWPAKRKREYGIVFETEGEKVISFRAGTKAAIAWVEGCE